MTQATRFRSVLVGTESLTIECGELLRERGHTIAAVVTDAAEVRRWAEQHALPVVVPGKDLATRLDVDVDYVLSIANLRVIPDDVLQKARHGGINFHDGPLPRYAGLYATSWALMNREPAHGVSWHRIEGGIDEGALCAQRVFDVADGETALTLNAKCFAAGIETFRDLVLEIEAGTLAPKAQDLSKRTYFSRQDRPDAIATIDWAKDAAEIVALVRALDFGGYPSPLAVAKTVVDGRVVLVQEAHAVARRESSPGTVLEVGTDEVIIACGDGAVAITRIADADGVGLAPCGAGFVAGAPITDVPRALRERLGALHRELCVNETFWSKRLAAPALALGASAPSSRQSPSAIEVPASLEGDVLVAALALALARIARQDVLRIGYSEPSLTRLVEGVSEWVSAVVPLRLALDATTTVGDGAQAVRAELAAMREKKTFVRDLRARVPALDRRAAGDSQPTRDAIVIARADRLTEPLAAHGTLATLHVGSAAEVRLVPGEGCPPWLGHRLEILLASIAREPAAPLHTLSVLSASEQRRVLVDFNDTSAPFESACVHHLFEAQVARTPDAVALVFEDRALTYRELDHRANELARRLAKLDVVPDTIVGLAIERSLEMVVGLLGILKAGGAYLPLDPGFPPDRLALMLEDSGARVVVTTSALASTFDGKQVVLVDDLSGDPVRVDSAAQPESLAYVLYTSGSTGRPKGVMVEHRNVASFFAGMDARIGREPKEVWLAVTSLSFDISVLELVWTLTRGFRVVVHRDRRAEGGPSSAPETSGEPMDFGLCYWGNDDQPGRGKYELLLEGARFADTHGFHSIWTPERHFHAFGGPFPNPAVSGAAVAAITRNLHVRAASVVLPLHHPVRVAEEWAMIDNLSNGRVGLGIASGWQPDDFVLRPENTPPAAKDAMFRDIEVLRRLWRGDAVEFPRKDGTMHAVVSQPRPVQKELPIWLTIALNPESYRQAADVGANVLTHLLGQSIDELAGKIRIYRDRLAELGKDPRSGKVTLMLHTFVAPDRETAREVTREPLKKYLASAASLIKQYVWMFPALKRPHGAEHPDNIDLASVDAEEMDAILEYAFHRYFDESGLLGSVEDGVARVRQLRAIGVDEIGCLIDFGVETKTALAHLPHLAAVVARTSRPAAVEHTLAQQIERHGVTHLQCTPSMARMLLLEEPSRAALGRVKHLMIGGEALPVALASELRSVTSAQILDMYGPTETTIWSSTEVVDPSDSSISIGRPIANTSMYILDAALEPVPIGETGELWIGGPGVARGYHGRVDLTRERFLPDPFSSTAGARMYRTGDLARFREDGRIDFLGRADHQVKVRGYRIELGEIESVLAEHPSVREAVVVARAGSLGDAELVAYVTAKDGAVEPAKLKEHLAGRLPPYMVPSRFAVLASMPLTPNKKVDRNALPAPELVAAPETAGPRATEPESDLERTIAAIWCEVLSVARVGREESFFDIGGHSLLAVRLHRRLKETITQPIAMTDVFRFPTVRALAEHLGGDGGARAEAKLDAVASRGAARRAAMLRRPR